MSEYINNQPHWRCRLCGFSSPLSASICGNPSCGADLAIYGEAVTPGPEEQPSRWEPEPPTQEEPPKTAESSWEETREPEEPQDRRQAEERRKSEETRDAAAERRRAAEERARKKAARRWRRQGSSKGLIAGLICLALVVCGGGLWMVFSSREPASDTTPGSSNSVVPPPVSSEEPTSPEPDASVQDPEPWRKNVLMADPCTVENWEEATEYPAFGSTIPQNLTPIPRKEIGSVTFVDSLDHPAMKSVTWDVSEAQDRSVLISCDYNSTTGKYDLSIGADGGVMAPADCSGMFFGYINVERIDFGGAFHTDNTETMAKMFCQCHNLKELNLSGFNTSNVTSMRIMFSKCYSLAKLDISSFDTAKVEDMFALFNSCSTLTELDVSHFYTSNVSEMALMFENCSGLSELDVTGFNTEKVTSMSRMFNGCSGLTELDISNFKTGNVTEMDSMLDGVRDDFVLHYSPENFDTSKVLTNENFMPDSFDWEKMFD